MRTRFRLRAQLEERIGRLQDEVRRAVIVRIGAGANGQFVGIALGFRISRAPCIARIDLA